MEAVRLRSPGLDGLTLEAIETPRPATEEALVRVHAAAITRDELEWPIDRLPAIPSYELSGVVVALGADASGIKVGDAVFALTPFDRDGVAAEYTVVPAELLAPKPRNLDHVTAASVPLSALTAWQGLFDHGRLEAGERVVIHGATGGVGAFATQLARWRGAHVVPTASRPSADGIADEGSLDEVRAADLVFDTAGGETLVRSVEAVRAGSRIVSVAEEPPLAEGVEAVYFVVRPQRDQLLELSRLVEEGEVRTQIDSVFLLEDARAAFERSLERGKNGKVVLRIVDE
jgi:NADPH:quinone reductase-like Zn-dependent oxidoreductase